MRQGTKRTFGQQANSRQAPLVEKVSRFGKKRAATPYFEAWWPVYVGVGFPALLFLGVLIYLAADMAGGQKGSILVLALLSVPWTMGFLLVSVFFTRLTSSVRSGAQTVGNLTFLSKSSPGFKIGAAIGFVIFLVMTPEIFGDPFTSNPSAPSAVFAQFMLKAIAIMGLCGAVVSRIERRVITKIHKQPAIEGYASKPSHVPTKPEVLPPPAWLQTAQVNWAIRMAIIATMLMLLVAVILQAFDGDPVSEIRLMGTIIFGAQFGIFMVLYFLGMKKILRGLSRLYGFTTDVH